MRIFQWLTTSISIITIMVSIFAFDVSHAGPINGIKGSDITSILTKEPTKVIDDSKITGNPIKAGADSTVGKGTFKDKIEGLFDSTGTTYESTLSQGMQRIQNFTNWALGLLALICVIYLVYHGVIMMINVNDDKAISQGLGSITTVARVLGGIGLSWILISLAFYVVKLLS